MSIYPDRKNGCLTGRFRVEVGSGSNRKRGRANTLPEARQLEADLLAALKSGAPLPKRAAPEAAPASLTLAEAERRAKPLLWAGQKTEPASLAKLSRIVDIMGKDTVLDAVDANTLDTLIVELKDGGCSPATVNRYLSNVSAFLKFCYKRGFRTKPVPELEWHDEGEGRIRWVTYDEEAKLMKLLPAPFDTVVYVAIRTGMRAMELLSIEPDQLTERWVHLWETKNGSARSVPLNAELHGLLEPLVLRGEMPDYWQLRYEWDKARKALGLQGDHTFVFHACRHTYATRAVQAGVNIRVLQKLMGHKTIQTTLRYAHVDDKTLSDAATAALDFHSEAQAKGGGVGGVNRLRSATLHRGEQRRTAKPDGGVVTQRTANPRTPVRFRLGPPFL